MRRSALIISGAAILSGLACSSGPPDPAQDRLAQVVFADLRPALLSVSGTSSGEVYAVGADPGDGLGPYVLHYDGQGWRRLESGAEGELWWISVEPIDGAFYMSGSRGKVLKYTLDSGEFDLTLLPDGLTMFGVWGTSASDIWAVGGDLDTDEPSGAIWHFDGASWSRMDLSAAAPEGVPTLYKVWGRSRDDVFAVGRFGMALHFDGQSWSRVEADTEGPFFTVHGNAEQVVASGGIGSAVIAELADGGSFINRAAAGTIQMNGVYMDPYGWGVSVGSDTSIAFRTSSGWELQNTGLDSPQDLHAVWVDAHGGVWAVGGNLTASMDHGIVVYIGSEDITSELIGD